MDYITLITLIFDKIMECRENRSRDQVKATAKNGPLARVIVRRGMRDDGYSSKEIRKAMKIMRNDNTSDKEIEAMVDEAFDA